MSEFETLVQQCVDRGYHPWLRRYTATINKQRIPEWECELGASVDVRAAEVPRPRAKGPTALAALVAAMEKM